MTDFASTYLFADIDNEKEDIFEDEVSDGIAHCAEEQAEAWAQALDEQQDEKLATTAFVKEVTQLARSYTKKGQAGSDRSTRLQPRFQKGAFHFDAIAKKNESERMAAVMEARAKVAEAKLAMAKASDVGFEQYRAFDFDDGQVADEGQTVVVEVGSMLTSAGWAGDDAPRSVAPSIVGRPRHCGVMVGMGQKDAYVGDEAQCKRGILTMSYPVTAGEVENWDNFEKLLHHTFYNELRIAPEENAVLLSVHPATPTSSRERMTRILHETFQVQASAIVSQASLGILNTGNVDGLFVGVGMSGFSVVPVIDGAPIEEAAVYSRVGGRHVTDYLMKIMTERGYSFTTTAERDLVRNCKQQLCFVSEDFDQQMKSSVGDASLARAYELPDGQLITLEAERFRAPEILFSPAFIGSGCLGLSDAIFSSIMLCHPRHRQSLAKNIAISGGSSLFPGLKERITRDLTASFPLGMRIHCIGQYGTWVGGSVLASVKLPWYTHGSYDDNGPSAFDAAHFKASRGSKVDVASPPVTSPPQEEAATVPIEPAAPTKTSSVVRTQPLANTNSMLVHVGRCAESDLPVQTGDPTRCPDCSAILTSSQTVAGATWTCRICDAVNQTEDDVTELPKMEGELSFLLQPATTSAGPETAPVSTVVFCVDVSGSMGTGSGSTGISRLACMQMAVRDQIEYLVSTAPETKVALVAFASDINFYHVTSRRMSRKLIAASGTQDEIVRQGCALAATIPTVGSSCANLLQAVSTLKPLDCTALGPAMAFSTAIASAYPGSKVILCTDGAANRGFGALSDASAGSFYSQMGATAKAAGVQLHVITTEGQNSGLESLGKASDLSSGSVEIVNPLKLGTVFRKMLEDSTTATSVTTTVLLGDGLQFAGSHLQTEEISTGSISAAANATFHLELREEAVRRLAEYYGAGDEEAAAMRVPYGAGIPVQVQVAYTTSSGDKKLWVRTFMRQVTVDRMRAEEAPNSTVVCVQAIQASANYAQQGRYDDARINLISTQRLLQRTMTTDAHRQAYLAFIVQAEKLDQFMRESQAQEQLLGSSAPGACERDDEGAKAMYQMKRVTIPTFAARC